MATTTNSTPARSAESTTRSTPIETRIDAPHAFGDRPADAPATAAVTASNPDPTAAATSAVDPLEGAWPTPGTGSIDFVQLRIHARQIATQLKTRKEELECREAAMVQQHAELERSTRQARLQLEELQQAASARNAELQRREQQYLERIEQLIHLDDPAQVAQPVGPRSASLDDPRLIAVAELVRRWHEERRAMSEAHDELRRGRDELSAERAKLEQEIVQQRESAMRSVHAALEQVEKRREAIDQRETVLEQQWQQRQQALDERQETLEAAEYEWSRRAADPSPAQRELADSLSCREEMIADRERQFLQIEEQLQVGLAEVDRQRAELRAERERLDGQARADRQRLADEQRRRDEELLARRAIVEQQAAEVDARRAAVENEHDEVLRLHRETLELRMATEELWTQLADTTPSAQLTQSLAHSRQRLDDHYQLESAAVERRKAQLDQLRLALNEQIAQLHERHAQLGSWLADRRAELEQYASALVSREQELHQSDGEFRQAQQVWQRQRLELEQEVRRLKHALSVARLQQ